MLNQHFLQKKLASLAAFSLIMSGVVSLGTAASKDKDYPSAENGYELAAKFCKSCHIIGDGSGGAVPVGPPPFSSIANKPGQTAERIQGSLVQPHPPMPDTHLSNEEIMDIIAYLETLRTDDSIPPFLPPPGQAKPKYPSPT